MSICKYCGAEIDRSLIATHTRWCKENPNYDKIREQARKNTAFLSSKKNIDYKKVSESLKKAHKDGKYANRKSFKGHKHTEETKKLLSEKRKEYLKNNKEKHPWKNNEKFISGPCERFKLFLKSLNISFVEEFIPLDDRNFSIDIAFPDKKIGIEINGNQHYDKNGDLRDYYLERHRLIEASGWKLYEFHYLIAYKLDKFNSIKELDDILSFDKNIDYREYEKLRVQRINQKREINRQKEKEHRKLIEKNKKKRLEEIEERKRKVLESGIDFSHFGWVGKLSSLLEISNSQTRRWMIKYMKDFYDVECFKRKSPVPDIGLLNQST